MKAMNAQLPSQLSFHPSYDCYAQRKEVYYQKPWTHVEKRRPVVAEYPTPGPNTMAMPSYIGTQVMNSAVIHRPAWSFGSRFEKKLSSYKAAPNSYGTQGLTSRGGKIFAPAYTMRIRTRLRPLEELPGPATYEVKAHHVLPRAPEFSLREKPMGSISSETPAPNEYTLPTLLGHHKTPPAHIMGYRVTGKVPAVTPGPGAYSHQNFIKHLQQSPEFSIRKRITTKLKEDTPGPGSYCPERVILNHPVAPRPTLGIKHSPYSGTWHPRIVGPRYC